MAATVVVSCKEPRLTATAPRVSRGQFALELEKVFEQYYPFVYRTAYTLTGSYAASGKRRKVPPASGIRPGVRAGGGGRRQNHRVA